MGVLSILGRRRVREVVPPLAQAEQPAAPTSPYSPQYETIVAQGHEQPTPVFVAPALVWHVGLWPRLKTDSGERCDPHDTPDDKAVNEGRKADSKRRDTYKERRETHTERRRRWVEEIDARLKVFDGKGRWRKAPSSPHTRPKQFIEPGSDTAPDTSSVTMTLWWRAPAASGAPQDGALRVRLHCNLTPDYMTFSFYLDVNTLWGGADPGAWDPRRNEILKAIGDIRAICKPAPLAQSPLPEKLSQTDDEKLTNARNLLYVWIWEQFAEDMECRLDQLVGFRSEVFANFRGLVLEASAEAGDVHAEGAPFPRYSADPQFDRDGVEANVVVNAHWPLVRRITPAADYREFVVCGLLNWRALYVTALGSRSQYDKNEERPWSLAEKTEADICVRQSVLSGVEHATPDDDRSVYPRLKPPGNIHPVRYLMLTKPNPNGRQLGRIVERINAMGTLRLYALKDWDVVQSADAAIRILGQDLDKITSDWSRSRDLLDDFKTVRDFVKKQSDKKYEEIHEYIAKADIPGWLQRQLTKLRLLLLVFISRDAREILRNEDESRALDIRYAVLAEISSDHEGRLIRIGAALDEIGEKATGGLHFRINRSRYHVAEFRRLLDSLQVGNVQTWTSYEQFVNRGLGPVFDYIDNVGVRINSLRDRLLAVLETIETSALVGQSSATRYNTAELKSIMRVGLLMVVVYLLQTGIFATAWDLIKKWVPTLFETVAELVGRLQGLW